MTYERGRELELDSGIFGSTHTYLKRYPHFAAHTSCEKTVYMQPFTPHDIPPEYKRQVHREFAKL